MPLKLSTEPLNLFVFPGQIPLQYAALEKDVAAQENAQSCIDVLQSPVEIKSSSREQVISEAAWFDFFI